MTQGVKLTVGLNIAEFIKVILITSIISFGGLSVHAQVLGIISSKKIRYKYFLYARIVHSILAIILVSIMYLVFIN